MTNVKRAESHAYLNSGEKRQRQLKKLNNCIFVSLASKLTSVQFHLI